MVQAKFENNSPFYCKHWRVTVRKDEDERFVVRFFDMTQKKFPDGQIVGDYYLSTLMEEKVGPWQEVGLALWGDVPYWSIAREDFRIIREWLSHIEQV